MLTDIAVTARSEFRVGLVFSQTFDVLKSRFGTYFLLASISALRRAKDGIDIQSVAGVFE